MMEFPFSMISEDGQSVHVYHWAPADRSIPPRGVIEIVHGMAETAKRYEEAAAKFVEKGFLVYAADLRGHGLTASQQGALGYAGKDGHNAMVKDTLKLGQEIRKKHEGLPLFLFGHSMGSFLVQKIMYTAPEIYAGFLLTGTCGARPFISIGERIAALQCRLQGDRKPSQLLNGLVFGPYNRQFAPVRTPFDWLTRDEEEVDKYIDDPCCGELCSAGFFCDFFRLLSEIHRPSSMAKIPKEKPVFIFCGEQDPVGLNGKGVRRLIDGYGRLGLKDFEWKLYPGARHELLHEINRDEVIRDVIGWLERHTLEQPSG
ncbi:alpha/beta fold hydrolase [Paenibacillus caui]|uniref:alpha/beta fold hydrolase n=1 Tax=Paenibacillus caui TaxID=2873927 RepID=UPI001CA81039|nr:alpha/beta fold hydrolase [Paenibacillus caui]